MTECFLRSVDQLFQALSTDCPEYQLTGGRGGRGGRGCPHSIDQLTLRTQCGNDIIKNLEDPDMYTSVEDRQVKQRMLDLQEKLIMKRALELLRTSNMNDDCKEEGKQNLLHFTRAVTSIMSTDNQNLVTPMQDIAKLVEYCYGTSEDEALQYMPDIIEITGRLNNKEHRFHKPISQFDIGQDLSGTVSTLMLYWNLDIDSQPHLDAISGKIELGSYLFC